MLFSFLRGALGEGLVKQNAGLLERPVGGPDRAAPELLALKGALAVAISETEKPFLNAT